MIESSGTVRLPSGSEVTTSYGTEQRRKLLAVAEEAIRHGVIEGEPLRLEVSSMPSWAQERRATFVTVYLGGALNGCIGSLDARRPVAADIAHNAHRAAFSDPRFPPITAETLDEVTVHLAILGALEPLVADDEADLIAQVRPGIDGIVLEDGRRRGTFLPAVWKKLPEPTQFLHFLKQKAGFQPDEWPETMKIYRFEVEEFDRAQLV